MSKKLFSILVLYFCGLIFSCCFASEYHVASHAGTIHTVKIVKGWCGNLRISTKVGHITQTGCTYEKETTPYGYDGCLHHLNGGLLENKVGLSYTCGATHIVSNVDGSELLDEFIFSLDNHGHYTSTQPSYSEVELKHSNKK